MSLSYGEKIESLKGLENLKQQIEKNNNILNVTDLKQFTNPDKYGGFMLSTLLFTDGANNGVLNIPGSFRYIAASDKHQRFSLSKAKWVDLVLLSNKKVLAEKMLNKF